MRILERDRSSAAAPSDGAEASGVDRCDQGRASELLLVALAEMRLDSLLARQAQSSAAARHPLVEAAVAEAWDELSRVDRALVQGDRRRAGSRR